MDEIEVVTERCVVCGKKGSVTLTGDQYARLIEPGRPHMQDALPDVAPEVREQLISGTHPECWSRMMAELEDE
jgi:hypothetical protein